MQQAVQTQQISCECFGTVVSRVCRKPPNEGREFFSCQKCGSFLWCDAWNGHPMRARNVSVIPYNQQKFNQNVENVEYASTLAEVNQKLDNIMKRLDMMHQGMYKI